MRIIPVAMTDELEKEALTDLILVRFDTTTPIYGTSLDIDIYHEGNKYSPIGIRKGELQIATALTVDRFYIELDNADLRISSIMLQDDPRNKMCYLKYGVLLEDYSISVATFFTGFIENVTKDSQANTVRIDVVNQLTFWNQTSLRKAQASCPWVFKGTFCQYTGSEVRCDKSYDRCLEYGNTINFGGCRFLPALAEKKIWWGKIPKA